MANGKKTYKEQIVELKKDNEFQTEKIDKLDQKMDKFFDELNEHKSDSEDFRIQQGKNTTNIKNIKEESLPGIKKLIYGLYGVIGAAVLAIISAVIKYFFSK